MMLVLLIAGIGFVLAGIVAIVFGIPVKEFSFGNTLMLIGAVSICTGMILVGLAAVVGELKLIARRVAGRPVAEPRPRDFLPPIPAGGRAGASEGARLQDPVAADPAASPSAETPWQDDAAARTRQDAPPPLGSIPTETPPSARPRRNLLFSSTSRKDRAASPTDPAGREVRATEPPAPEPDESEGAWRRPERGRPPEFPPRRFGRQHPATDDTGKPADADDRSAPARDDDQSGVTVIKSGVVDGMAYSLYSDGSIEAQMPEGMMRFASIDELRAHLDQRS